VSARERQVVDQAGQKLGFVVERAELLRGGLGDAVLQGLDLGLEHSQGRPQLVSDVGNQALPSLLLPGQRFGHAVERGGQLSEFVVRGVADPAREVAGGYGAGPL
jgi:hypothetical protein